MTVSLEQNTLQWQPLYEPGCGGRTSSIAISPHDSNRVIVGGDMLGARLSNDQGDSWQSIVGFKSWEIADFTWHPTNPNIVWAGTMSGPYLSVDGGLHWQEQRNGFPLISDWFYSAPIQKVLFDPNDTTRLIAVGGSHRRWSSLGKPMWGAVWESRNSGKAWKQIATLPYAAEGKNIVAAAFGANSSNIVYAAVDDRGVYKSLDGGRTWTARNNGLPHTAINDLVVHPQQRDTLWIVLGRGSMSGNSYQPGGVFKSTDGGMTWKSMQSLPAKSASNPNLTTHYETVAISPSNPNILLTSDTAWNNSIIYKSTNNGVSWSTIATPEGVDTAMPSGLAMTAIKFAPQDAKIAFTGGSEYVLRTLDGGRTWVDVTAYHPKGASAWRGRGYAGWVGTNFKFDSRDSKHSVLLGMDHGNFWQSWDSLQTWRWGGQGIPTWGGSSDVTFTSENTMYVTLGQGGDFGGIAKTINDGRTWTVLSGAAHGLPEKSASVSALGIYALPNEPNVVWTSVGGKLYHSTDGGEKWRIIHAGPEISWIAAARKEPRHFYVTGSKGVYETVNGNEFKLIAGSPKKAGHLALGEAGRLYVTVWRNKDGGLWKLENDTWIRLRSDPYIANVAIDPKNSYRLVIVTDDQPYHDVSEASGVWISQNSGETWSQQNGGLACLRGTTIAFNPHNSEQLIFGSGGCGFWMTRWPQ